MEGPCGSKPPPQESSACAKQLLLPGEGIVGSTLRGNGFCGCNPAFPGKCPAATSQLWALPARLTAGRLPKVGVWHPGQAVTSSKSCDRDCNRRDKGQRSAERMEAWAPVSASPAFAARVFSFCCCVPQFPHP